MSLALPKNYPPMEAMPAGKPKWDGFRCLAFRDAALIVLQSKSGKPLTRYFPELVSALSNLKAKTFVLDGEIVIPARRWPLFR